MSMYLIVLFVLLVVFLAIAAIAWFMERRSKIDDHPIRTRSSVRIPSMYS